MLFGRWRDNDARHHGHDLLAFANVTKSGFEFVTYSKATQCGNACEGSALY